MKRMKRDVYENPDELIAFLQDLKKERESKGSQIFPSELFFSLGLMPSSERSSGPTGILSYYA